MSNLRDAIRAATDARDKQSEVPAALPENQNTSMPENQKPKEEMVNLAIKVSLRQRTHWLIEAKKQRTSLTAAIIEALNARFGSVSEE